MPTRPLAVSSVAVALILAALPALAQAPQQPPPGQQPQVVVPDSRGWTKEQAIVNLRSSDKGTRLAALQRLVKEPGADVQKWIAEAAQYDPEPRIRFEAVKALEARAEPASLPILMHIAETDKDDRVRTAARIASGVGGQPQPAQPAQPGQPAAQPGQRPEQPAPVEPPKRYDAAGNELPPGYMDADAPPHSGAAADDGWGAAADSEAVAGTAKGPQREHSGFLPQLGFDGAMGSPRDTLNRTDVGIQLGLGYGRFDRVVRFSDLDIFDGESRSANRYTSVDFGLQLLGHWSPGKYLEIGLAAEVLTFEKMEHLQYWERRATADDDWERVVASDEPIDGYYAVTPEQMDNILQRSSYKGLAFGLLSLDLKSVFLQTDLLRLGIALRTTFPTHTGARYDRGLGAADLFLPGETPWDDHYTEKGLAFGLEPGVVASVAPIDHLTIYADLTFAMSFLKFDVVTNVSDDRNITETKASNFFFIPHFGVQYRLLDERLGLQLAFAPVAYLGKGDAGLAAFAIVPGAAFRATEHLGLSLTVDIDAGSDAAHQFQCAGLSSGAEAQLSKPAACGVGRQVGFALQSRWEF